MLYLATSVIPFWQATENWLAEANVDATVPGPSPGPAGRPWRATCSTNPDLVRGRRVLDFAAGGGIAGIAAAQAERGQRAGRRYQSHGHSPPPALNAQANGVDISGVSGDIVGQECRWDLILAGDVCYEAPMTGHILPLAARDG